MVQALEADLKQIVLTSGPFGPQEIRKLEQAIAEDFSQFRACATRSARSKTAATAARPRPSAWASAITCWAAISWPPKPSKRATAEPCRTSISARPTWPWAITTRPCKTTPRPPKPATTPTNACSPAARPCAAAATPRRPWPLLDNLSGAVEQTAEYLYQRASQRGRHRRQSARSRGAVRAGGRGRPQSPRRPVRTGPGKRSPRQRRSGPRSVRAGRASVSLARRSRC